MRSGTISANIAGAVGLTKTTTSTVTLTGGLAYTGQTVVNGGTLEAIGSGGSNLLLGGGLDVQSGQVVWDYTGVAGVSPGVVDPILFTALQQSYLNNWAIDMSHPVGSTTAYADWLANGSLATHGLGFAETVVGGETLVTVGYTLYGDANLDGTVNGGDLNTVLSNFQQTGYWYQGDFNFDGTINGADLNIVLSNFQQALERHRRRAGAVEPAVDCRRPGGPLGLRLAETEVIWFAHCVCTDLC